MVKAKPVEVSPAMPRLLTVRDALSIAIAGAVVGLIVLAVYFMLDKYVFTPGLCGEGADPARCDSKVYFVSTLSMVIGGLAGLFALVRQRAFRPLLVVLLASVGLWDIVLILAGMTWWAGVLLIAVIFAAAYLAFAWLVQLRNFYLALGISAVVIVLMRLIMMS